MSSRVLHKKDKNPYIVTNSECYMTLDKLPTQRAPVLSQEPLFQQHSPSQPKNKGISFVNIDPKNVIVLPMEKHQLTVDKHAVESSTDASHLPTPLDNKQIKEHEMVLDNSPNKIPKYNSVHDTLFSPLWNISIAESGLTENENNVMYEVSKNVKNFCDHFVKQLIYECAMKDGLFVRNAARELTSILNIERRWCHSLNVLGNENLYCPWKNITDTAHALVRSVTHMHPVIVRLLIREFRLKKTLSEKQDLLRMCLLSEIYFYRDKMNNWDYRFYKYILEYNNVCTQIVYTLDRLEQNIVLMEWTSDWTGFFYFCQYEHGPFYHLLHPITKEKGMSLRIHTNAQKQKVSCRDSILSLENLTHEDYLTIIKDSWHASHDNFTYVDVSDEQILKLKKLRLSVEKHLLMIQQAFFKFEGEMRKNLSVKMFDDPNFPIITRACELISGSYWKNLMTTVPVHGYFGEIFMHIDPCTSYMNKLYSVPKQDKNIKLMCISAFKSTESNKLKSVSNRFSDSLQDNLQTKPVSNPFILQVGIDDHLILDFKTLYQKPELKFNPTTQQTFKMNCWIEHVKKEFQYEIWFLEDQINHQFEEQTNKLIERFQFLNKQRLHTQDQSNDQEIKSILEQLDSIEHLLYFELMKKVNETLDRYETINSEEIVKLFHKGTKIIKEEIGDLNDFDLENILGDTEIDVEDMKLVENQLPQSERRKSLFLNQNDLSEAILTSTDITISSPQNSWDKKLSFTPGQDTPFLPPKPSFIIYQSKVVKKLPAKRSENMYKCWGCESTFDNLDDFKKHLEELRNTEVQDKQVLRNRAELNYNAKMKTIQAKYQKSKDEQPKSNTYLLLHNQEKASEHHERIEKLKSDYELELKQIDELPLMKLSHQNIRRRYIDTINMDKSIKKKILKKEYELESKFNQISLIIESLNYFHMELVDFYSSEHQEARTIRILENELLDAFQKGQSLLSEKENNRVFKKLHRALVTNTDVKMMVQKLMVNRADILETIQNLYPLPEVETFYKLFLSSNTTPPSWINASNILSLEEVLQKEGKRDSKSHNHVAEMEFDEKSFYDENKVNYKKLGRGKWERSDNFRKHPYD